MTDPIPDDMLAAWLSGDLDAADATVVDAAVAADPEVAARADRLADMMGRLAEAGAGPAPDTFADDLSAGLAAALGAAALGAAADPATVARAPGRPRPSRPWAAGSGSSVVGSAPHAGPRPHPRRASRAARLQRMTGGLAVLLLVVTTGTVALRGFRDGPPSPSPSPTVTAEDPVTATPSTTGTPEVALAPTAPASGAATPTTRPLPEPTAADDTDDVLSEGAPGGGTTADPAPSAVPGQDPAEPAPSPPSTGPDTPEDQAATPPPSVPAPTAAPPQSEGGPEALGEDDGTPPEEEAAAPPPEDEGAEEDQGTDEDVAAPEAAPPPTDGDAAAGGSGGGGGGTSPQPATTPTIADTQVPLPDDEAVVAHFGSRPETEALLGLAEEEASERAAAHREAIGAAGPFADGSHPADCLSATAVGPGPDVVAAVESGRDADGQAVLAYLVVSGTPALDQARVVVADPDGCLSRIIPIPT